MSAAEILKDGTAEFSYKIARAALTRNRKDKRAHRIIIPESVGKGLVLELRWTAGGADLEVVLRREQVAAR
jgi:hypothetical protein